MTSNDNSSAGPNLQQHEKLANVNHKLQEVQQIVDNDSFSSSESSDDMFTNFVPINFVESSSSSLGMNPADNALENSIPLKKRKKRRTKHCCVCRMLSDCKKKYATYKGINEIYKKIMSQIDQRERDKYTMKYMLPLKVIICINIFTTMCFQLNLIAAQGANLQKIQIFYWILWFILIILYNLAQYLKKPLILRFIIQLQLIRNIIPLFEIN